MAQYRCPYECTWVNLLSTEFDGKPGSHHLALLLDTTNGEQPLPADQWKRGHVVTPAMFGAIDAFLEHTVVHAHDTLPLRLPDESFTLIKRALEP